MAAKTEFYRCDICGNIVLKVEDGGGLLVCCGQAMELLVANTVDASVEKHVPAVTVDGDVMTIKIGSDPHPMTEAHYIEFIYLATAEGGGVLRKLQPGEEPEATFDVGRLEPVAAYEYCNLHGLWVSELS